MSGRWLPAVAAAIVLVAACSGGGEDPAPPAAESTTTTETTATIEYRGDPDSEFCRRLAAADERPVLDPFEAGLEPSDVEVRFRALQLRFDEYAEVAPPELADDLDQLVTALAALEDGLAAAGFDFEAMAERGADVSAFDDASFAEIAARISAYRTQVCRPSS